MRKGNQIPRIRIEPPRIGSDGPGAAKLMQAYGVQLDEWQKLCCDAWLGKDADGRYTATSAGLSTARQNGKTAVLIARCFYGLVINGERVLFSSHQMRSVKKVFRRFVNMFTDKQHPEIMKTVKKIRYGIGEESIELNNGGIIEFMSRSRQAARGYDGISVIVIDEAQEATDDMLEALLAVLSSSQTGTRQVIYAGTPPYPGCPGTVFRRFRQTCIDEAGRGEVKENCWHEWSIAAESLDEIDIEDRDLWFYCNPGLGTRLTEEFTATEAATLSKDGFARERLNFWAKPAARAEEFAINAELWDSCRSNAPKPDGKTAYGVKFSADGSAVVLAGACIGSDGAARITLISERPTGAGLNWLVEWLNERYKRASCVVIDGRNGADLLVDKLAPVWIYKNSVIKPSAQNVVMAANMLLNELAEKTLTWYSEQDSLRESAITARKRSIAGGWGFGGSGSEAIEACSLALWGCRTSKRNPQRVMRIG